MTAAEIHAIFEREYMNAAAPQRHVADARGDVEAVVAALSPDRPLLVLEHQRQATVAGTVAFVELRAEGEWPHGAGLDADADAATVKAVVAALNRRATLDVQNTPRAAKAGIVSPFAVRSGINVAVGTGTVVEGDAG